MTDLRTEPDDPMPLPGVTSRARVRVALVGPGLDGGSVLMHTLPRQDEVLDYRAVQWQVMSVTHHLGTRADGIDATLLVDAIPDDSEPFPSIP